MSDFRFRDTVNDLESFILVIGLMQAFFSLFSRTFYGRAKKRVLFHQYIRLDESTQTRN